MEKWINGASGATVQQVIENNFAELERAINRLSATYVRTFKVSEWSDGAVFVDHFHYNKLNPTVELYIKQPTGYEAVIGGYEITSGGVRIFSDLAYDGKVVIK